MYVTRVCIRVRGSYLVLVEGECIIGPGTGDAVHVPLSSFLFDGHNERIICINQIIHQGFGQIEPSTTPHYNNIVIRMENRKRRERTGLGNAVFLAPSR